MTLVIPFGHCRRLTVLFSRRLAFVNWSFHEGRMWLTSRDMTFWHRVK